MFVVSVRISCVMFVRIELTRFHVTNSIRGCLGETRYER